MRLLQGPPFFALLVLGCAPIDPPSSGQEAPSAEELRHAVQQSLPSEIDGMTVGYHCPRVTRIQCAPVRNGQRFRCSYEDEGGAQGTVLVERRTNPVDLEYYGPWRLIRGSMRCGAY